MPPIQTQISFLTFTPSIKTHWFIPALPSAGFGKQFILQFQFFSAIHFYKKLK